MNQTPSGQNRLWRAMINRAMPVVLIASLVLSFMPTAVRANTNTPSDTPVWRVLWLVCKNTDQVITDTIRAKGSLSEENIHAALQIIPYFESFIERSVGGAVDVQITPMVSDSPADWFELGYNGNVGQEGYDLYHSSNIFLTRQHGKLLFDSEKKPLYESVVVFAGLEESQRNGYSGLTQGWMSFIPISDDDWVFPAALDLSHPTDYTQIMLLERVLLVVHEQIHYLEWRFGERHPVPTLHSKLFAAISGWQLSESWGYAYTLSNILTDPTRKDADFHFFSGLQGEILDGRKNEYIAAEHVFDGHEPWSSLSEAIWYLDYLAGTIRSEYSGAAIGEPYYEGDEKRFRHGIDRAWWANVTEEIYLYVGFDQMDTPGGRIPIDNNGTTPIIAGNRTLVPIRAIVEVLGGSVEWDSDKREIACFLNGHAVHMYLDSTTYFVDYDSVRSFDVPPMINNNRTMVPIRGVLEALGCTVVWVENGGGDGWNMVVVSSPYYTTIVSP